MCCIANESKICIIVIISPHDMNLAFFHTETEYCAVTRNTLERLRKQGTGTVTLNV
jgi:hypothetical protein